VSSRRSLLLNLLVGFLCPALFLWQAVRYWLAYAREGTALNLIAGGLFTVALVAWVVDTRRALFGEDAKGGSDLPPPAP
jgi:ABC-type uncharacterized transport system permease subunit